MHESIHRTAFKNRRLNDWVAAVLGFLIVLPADYFRFFHFAHHRYTQNPAARSRARLAQASHQGRLALGGHGDCRSGAITSWVSSAMQPAGRRSPIFAGNAARQVVREARIHLALYAAIALISVACAAMR